MLASKWWRWKCEENQTAFDGLMIDGIRMFASQQTTVWYRKTMNINKDPNRMLVSIGTTWTIDMSTMRKRKQWQNHEKLVDHRSAQFATCKLKSDFK